MWINGAYTTGNSGKVIEVRNPATEEIIDTAPAANANNINLASVQPDKPLLLLGCCLPIE